MHTQMFITSVVVQLLPQQLETSHLTPMLLHVSAMSLKCHSNVTPIGIELVLKKKNVGLF